MARWQDLSDRAPEIATAGRRLLTIPGVGYGYLATVGADGSPRIHPINVTFHEGGLYAFVVPSPKLADLRRDGRYALHSTGSEDISDEFSVAGQASEPAAELRSAVAAAAGYSVEDDHVLFELGIDRALWAEWSTPPSWPPTYHRWRADAID
jgi:hypothetical protein